MFRFFIVLLMLAVLWVPASASASACVASTLKSGTACGASFAADATICASDQVDDQQTCSMVACAAAGVAAATVPAPISPQPGNAYPITAASQLPHAAYYPALRPPIA